MKTEEIAIWIAVVSLIVLVWQNIIAKKSSETQNTITVWNFLLAEEYRKAREYVIQVLEDKEFQEWDEADEFWADKVCSSYSSAASLIKRKYLEKDMFLDDWGSSIKRTHKILEKHLNKRRVNMDDRYWDDFDWIYDQVLEWEKKKQK